MVGGLKNHSRRKKLGIISVAIVLGVLVVAFYQPSSPDGVYYDPYLACGHGCWKLKEGKIFTECDEEAYKFAGNFLKVNGEWIIQGKSGEVDAILKPSLFGLKVIDKQFIN